MSLFDDAHVISKHLNPIPLAELEELETELGIKFPAGYRDFITRFGEGVYCDLFRIFPPKKILTYYLERRGLWRDSYYEYEGIKHWFFEGNESIISPEQLQESFIIGDSLNGDQIVFYPPESGKLFILPRHSRVIDTVQADFSDLHHWDSELPMLKSFLAWEKEVQLSYHSETYSFTRENVLEIFSQNWNDLLVSSNQIDLSYWVIIALVPSISARIQIYYDEGSGTFEDEQSKFTVAGDTKPGISFSVDCHEDSASEVQAFFDSLQAQKLAVWL